MRFGISTRLFLAMLATAAMTVLLVSGATRWNFDRGFIGYLNDLGVDRMDSVMPRLQEAYTEQGNWDFLRGRRSVWFELLRPVSGGVRPLNVPREAGAVLTSDLTGAVLRLGVLDAQQQWVAGFRGVTLEMPHRAITAQGVAVGWVVLAPFQSVTDGGDQRFSQGQTRATVAVSVLAVLMAALIAWWVSRKLAEPLRRVAGATHRLAAGDHGVRVQVDSPDEVGQLARDFNHLAQTLERNETLRREFVADVSHELRTPLAVLRGELEALEDGVRVLDAQAVKSLQGEVRQLGQLVDDLYELALTDAGALSYRMEAMDLGELLRDIAAAHRLRIEAAGLQLVLDLPDEPVNVNADASRLQQLFDNLLENSRRYTDAPGQIRLAVWAAGAAWRIELSDSTPGVPAEVLGQLFERFYRVDGSRSRATGGAGLGLAICRNIVMAHDGRIEALASELGGVLVRIELPRLRDFS